MPMEWHLNPQYPATWELAGLPLWHQRPFPPMRVSVWIEPRPLWCDRGRWIAKTDAPLNFQEGWPRYYFDLATAKREVEAWIAARAEFRER